MRDQYKIWQQNVHHHHHRKRGAKLIQAPSKLRTTTKADKVAVTLEFSNTTSLSPSHVFARPATTRESFDVGNDSNSFFSSTLLQ